MAMLVLASDACRSAANAVPARIGWLKIQGPRHTPGQLQAFRQGMLSLGQLEGKNYVIDERYANGEGTRLPRLATELIERGANDIVATSQPSIAAAARVTHRVPVIGRMNDDPVTNGMAQSLARPGGNITGIYALTEALNQKRLALLKEAVPSLRRVGVLLQKDWSNAERDWQVAQVAAQSLGMEVVALNANSAAELAAAFDRAEALQVGGIMTFRNPTVVTHLKFIAEESRKRRLPAIFDAREYVEAGGLMSYGPNIDDIYRRLASYTYEILQGETAGELPIQQPTIFELVINRQTAQTIGVAVPATILVRADALIG